MKCCIEGAASCMNTFFMNTLLRHSYNLSRMLQSTNMSVAEDQKAAITTVAALQLIRSGGNFGKGITKMAEEKEIDESVLSWRKKLPR